MVSIDTFRQLALSFPQTAEQPHFEKTSFRVNKKIFATLDVKNTRACLMLSEVDQSVFSAFDKSVIYPVPNKWGKQGATFVELKTVRKSMLKDAMKQAYNKIIAKK
ncbi:MAG: MmcQ/YjbR family DNA-binding protein [Chitinophagaceae bacterium]|nr:MmcQ/YjbR family DNA-binding protein [Chitinophagaceae bacterium]